MYINKRVTKSGHRIRVVKCSSDEVNHDSRNEDKMRDRRPKIDIKDGLQNFLNWYRLYYK